MNRAVGQYIIAGTIFLFFVLVIHHFILPVIFGLLVSLVFRPLYLKLDAVLKHHHHLTAIASTFILMIGFLVPLILIGSVVAKDAVQFVNSILHLSRDPNYVNGSLLGIPAISKIYHGVNAIHPVSQESFVGFLKMAFAKTGVAGNAILAGLATSIPKIFVTILLFLVAFYFGLIDGPRFVRFLRNIMPFTQKETDHFFRRTFGICNAVVLGALVAGIIQGIILALGFWVLGVPRPLLAFVVTVISAFIPLMGAGPAGLGGTLYLLFNGNVFSAVIMFVLFLIASVTDNVVKPWVLKGKTELHPLLGLLSVLGGISIFGFAGIFLGPLVTALTVSFLEMERTFSPEEQIPSSRQKKNVKIWHPKVES